MAAKRGLHRSHMPEIKYFPINHLDEAFLFSLMEEEEKLWMSDLGWDYSPIRRVLSSFVKQRQLPGYVAVNSESAIGYIYFLANQTKGIIGSLYASKKYRSQEAVEQLISLAISHLKDSKGIQRIESQIMPFHNLNISATFMRHGFKHFARFYLDLCLDVTVKNSDTPTGKRIVPWSSDYLESASEMTASSYRDQIDAEICEDYRTKPRCENYLRSLMENPGCGLFMPDASFMALDRQRAICGFLFCCRISSAVAMIPQISVHPSHQGIGLGNSLIAHSLKKLKASGFHTVSLMVTGNNRRAFDWYQRLGFRIRKEFGAYVWRRKSD